MEKLKRLRPLLLVTSVVGFVVINLPFLYIACFEREIYSQAMSNGLALVFISEAFILMGLLAFLIAKLGWRRPGWLAFVAMSLLGSLAFSIPFFLYLHAGKQAAARSEE